MLSARVTAALLVGLGLACSEPRVPETPAVLAEAATKNHVRLKDVRFERWAGAELSERIFAEAAVVDRQTRKVTATKVRAELFGLSSHRRAIEVSAPSAEGNLAGQELFLKEEVHVFGENFDLFGRSARARFDTQEVFIDGPIKGDVRHF